MTICRMGEARSACLPGQFNCSRWGGGGWGGGGGRGGGGGEEGGGGGG